MLTPAPAEAAQTIPYKINFQGRLTDNSGNVLSDGAYNIKFRFFDAATVGVNKWEGDRVYGVSDNRVTVQNGLFNIQFGDTTKGDPALTPSLFNTVTNGNLWLEVELPTPATATCATNGCAVFTEGAMTPRQPLAASPYALNADTVDGIDGTSLVQLSPSLQQTGTINVSGNITSGGTVQGNTVDAATSGALTLGSSNATSVALAKNTTLGSGLTMTLQGTNALTLGSTTAAGGIVFQDGTVNNRTVTLNVPALPTASYSLTLPNAAPGTSLCLRSGAITASLLVWGACTSSSLDPSTLTTGSAAVTLQSAVSSTLTITSGTGTISLGSGTLQRSNAALSIDVLAASASTLTITNSNGSNVASLDVEGGLNIGSGQTYKIGNTQITSAALSNDANITKQGNTFNGTSQLVQTTAGGAYPALSGAAITSLNPTNLSQGTGAVTLQSAAGTATTITSNAAATWSTTGVNNLTIDAGGGTLIAGTNTSTLQKSGTAFSVDLNSASPSLLTVTNAGTGVGSLAVEGGISIGAGQTFKVNNVAISSADLSNDANITKQGNTFNGASQLVQLNGSTQLPAVSGVNLTNLNPTNLIQGTGAVTLQSAAAQNLTVQTSGASGIILNPGNTGLTTNLPAGIQAKFSATATPTADLLIVGNTAGQEPTGNLINALQVNWFAKPAAGNMSSGHRVDIANNNTATAGQVQGIRIVAVGAGGAINSDTTGLYIDALTNASTGTAGENAIEVGSGWDAGFLIQSGGNAISSTLTNSALSLSQSGNPAAGAALLYARNTNGAPSGNLIDLGNNTASVFNITATGTTTFQPTTDSQTAMAIFRSAAAGGTRMFAVDTEGITDPVEVQVGSSTTIDAVQVNFGIDSSNVFADAGTCTTTSNQGALYYNVAASAATQGGSNAIRACINGSWEDLISTAGLGVMLFGVVPDSGANPGDLAALVTSAVTGPCKVSWVANAATSTVRIEACVAYSGGRKVTIQQNTTFAVPTNVANGYSHICLNATGGIAATASNATETANLPALNVGGPLLCLADVRANGTANGIQAIYDTRTFTNTAKEFVNTAAATSLGVVAIASGTGVALPGGATVSARGVIVASNGAASIANAPNAIIATNGPAVAKATAGTAAQFVNISAATGYVTTAAAASATAYANLGYSRNSFPGTLCTTTANAVNCNRSIFFNLNLR